MTISFDDLRRANLTRVAAIHPAGLHQWNPAEWSNAMAGECGETCNLTKKWLRNESIPAEMIAAEIADVIIYADLLAAWFGIDLGTAVQRKFDEVSMRRGLLHRLVPLSQECEGQEKKATEEKAP